MAAPSFKARIKMWTKYRINTGECGIKFVQMTGNRTVCVCVRALCVCVLACVNIIKISLQQEQIHFSEQTNKAPELLEGSDFSVSQHRMPDSLFAALWMTQQMYSHSSFLPTKHVEKVPNLLLQTAFKSALK